MDKFNEAARTAYEDYLLGDDDVEDALLKMIPGSKYHDYLKIIDMLKKQKGQKGQLSKEIKDMIKKFKKKGGVEAKRVDYQSLFIEFDNLADDKKKQKELLKKLSGAKYLKLGLKNKTRIQEDENEGEKSESEDESRRSTLIFSPEDHNKEFLKKIHNESTEVSTIHPSFVDKIDFKALSDTYFQKFLFGYPHVADITTESFLVKTAELIDSEIKKDKMSTVGIVMQDLCTDSANFYKRFTLAQILKLAELLPAIKSDDNWHGSVFNKKFYKELNASIA